MDQLYTQRSDGFRVVGNLREDVKFDLSYKELVGFRGKGITEKEGEGTSQGA